MLLNYQITEIQPWTSYQLAAPQRLQGTDFYLDRKHELDDFLTTLQREHADS